MHSSLILAYNDRAKQFADLLASSPQSGNGVQQIVSCSHITGCQIASVLAVLLDPSHQTPIPVIGQVLRSIAGQPSSAILRIISVFPVPVSP